MTTSDQARKPATSFFHLWKPYRLSVLELHRFYIDQGKKKLLSQFEDIEKEASEAAERWLELRSQRFDPDRDDPGSILEDAYQEEIEYYQLLNDLRDQTRLSLVAGMYHAWDKELRGWLLKEIGHFHIGQNVTKKMWQANFDEIVELLDSTGLANRNASCLQILSACRYVVNVYKHGEGFSLDRLKQKHRQYLRSCSINDKSADMYWVDHTHLSVSDSQLDEFANAITDFWRSLPDCVQGDSIEVPSWLEKAVESDQKTKKVKKHCPGTYFFLRPGCG